MITLIPNTVYVKDSVILDEKSLSQSERENARKNTIAYSILQAHNGGDEKNLKLKFDALASHDITYVGIIQTAKHSGLTEFPVPYVLTNCHNSLCAVGGTINEDDHLFGLSAAKKYGGIFVPPHLAVIHTYMREMMSGCGKMILGSDSHTRYGALGTMAIGEGGPELVKQLIGKTYDIAYPGVVAVILKGNVPHGVGPQDVALAIIGKVFKNGFVKNKVMEFMGDGVRNLPVEFRNGIDVMTTETTCLSSIWCTDEKVEEYYKVRGRLSEYRKLAPRGTAAYDGAIVVDLSKVRPMIALPFHPANVYLLKDVIEHPEEILGDCEKQGRKLLNNPKITFNLKDKIVNGKVRVGQGIIAGCAGGTFDNVYTASKILKGHSIGNGEFTLDVYPSSQPIYSDLIRKGCINDIMDSGAIVKTAFCGPCFGAGDVPANNELSIRHTTRNFESREGSKPADRQIASVALMDSRSIAATARFGGILTSAEDVDYDETIAEFEFDSAIYEKRVYRGFGAAEGGELRYGPNIADWPEIKPLTDNILLRFAAVINDPVTTTDELIPSGETSSYRSNPMRLAEFALSRKAPYYVAEAKRIAEAENLRRSGKTDDEYAQAFRLLGADEENTSVASVIFAVKPGDGSAREQAASCQRVLGGGANVAREYATKRYRSNLINWGMIPFLSDDTFEKGDFLYVPDVKKGITEEKTEFEAVLLRDGETRKTTLRISELTPDERKIIVSGCLMNYNRDNR